VSAEPSGGPAGVVFRGWGWRYPEREAWAVRGVDLEVAAGERVAIVGPSGAGKSTLLRAVAGVLPDDDGEADPQEGTVLVDGRVPREARGVVGLVMQDPDAHTVMSRVGDDVAFGCENLGVPREAIWPRVRDALDTVGLDLPSDRSTSMLSGGQRQRLALAGILAMRPGVLVLDEPCANLDPDGVGQVHGAVRSLLDETGATLLVVEHRIGTWLDLVDRLVLIAPGGGVVADGAPAAVLAAHGAALTAAGVWVPGAEPAIGSARAAASDRPGGTVRVTASGASIGRGGRQLVADGIDLTVRGGRVLAVTGPNGVGKSTLGLTLGGLLAPSGGSLVAAETLADGAGPTPSRWSSRQLAARIGTVFQDPEHQFVARTVREELAVGPRAEGLPDAEVGALVDEVLGGFGLTHLADVSPFTLSGGEQRRLAIGTVVVTRPPVMILDEPTSGQDRATWQAVVDRLGALADAGTAVVLITHDRDLVRALDADELVLTAHGVRSADASPPAAGPAPEPRTLIDPPRGVLRAVQPVALLLGVIALGVCLVTSLDVVSASVALALELVLLPLARVRVRTLLLRGIPILVAAPLAGLSIALYGRASGRVWLDLGFAHVTDGSLLLAVATVLRLLAIGLPAVALFARVDPTDLGDGLAQVLRLPARFVLGALAALRMTTLLREDWQRLGMARRARGVADSGRIRRGASMAFALLVIALRRATALAVAMESRGFGARGARTWARPARFGAGEWATTGVCAAIGLVGIGSAVLAGTWHGV
jgi:energy-coupling factor transport system ATP-binding protein